MDRTKPKKRRLLAIVFGILGGILLLQLLFLPLPRFIAHYLAIEQADWLLNENKEPDSGPEKLARILTSELLQRSILNDFHDRHGAHQWADDAAYAGRLLHKLRTTLISQREIYHLPGGRITTLSGYGWCDELNGAAARLLALDFDRVEIVGVHDPNTGGGHSFGRFWSEQYADWLYYDIWTEEVLLFRLRPGAAPDYVYRSRPVGPSAVVPDDFAVLTSYHARAKQGFVHVRYQSTLAAHFGTRLWNLVSHGSTMPGEASAAAQAVFEAEKPAVAPPRAFPPHKTAQIRTYAKARLAHLSGDYRGAIKMYRRVARSDTKSSYGLASAKFLNRLTRSHPM